MRLDSDALGKTLRSAGAGALVASLSRLAAGKAAPVNVAAAAKPLFDQIQDTLLLDYLLNTFVSKIPFPHLRMDLYRAAGVDIHETSNIMMHAFVLQARSIKIGPHCIIGPFTTLDGRGTLTIGENVNIAGEVLTIGGHHAVDSPTAEGLLGAVVLEDYSWVGMRATILPGVTIGKGSYVAAAALVNRDVEPYTLVGGVPARKIRDRTHDLQYTLQHFPRWI